MQFTKNRKKSGIYLLNTNNYCTESVAEYTIAQILLYAKQFHLTYKDIRENKTPQPRKTTNILNKTIGIVGLGNIGTSFCINAYIFFFVRIADIGNHSFCHANCKNGCAGNGCDVRFFGHWV